MIAMLILMGSIYDYNLGHVEVQICVQLFLLGNKSDWLEVQSAIFGFALIFVLKRKRLHSYLNSFVIRITHIFRPQRDQDCRHIWTLT